MKKKTPEIKNMNIDQLDINIMKKPKKEKKKDLNSFIKKKKRKNNKKIVIPNQINKE